MGKQGLLENVNVFNKRVKSSKTGKTYDVLVADSNNRELITNNSEVGKMLRKLGFIWTGKNYQMFANHVTQNVLDSIKKINDYLNNQSENPSATLQNNPQDTPLNVRPQNTNFKHVNLFFKKLQSKKTGKSYDVGVIFSTNPEMVSNYNEVGMMLKRLGFLWTGKNFHKFANHITSQDIEAIKKINDDIEIQDNQQGNLQEDLQNLNEYISLEPQELTSGKSGKKYKVYIAKSNVPNEIQQKNQVGMMLKKLGFIWNVNKYQLFSNTTSDEVIDAIKKMNDNLKADDSGQQVDEIDDIQSQLEAIREAIRDAQIPVQTKTQLEADLEKFIKQIANATDQQADAIFNSYLSFSNNLLWEYSDENKLLIYAQRPDATKIAAKSDWLKKFGRDVPRPKETAITINCGNKMYFRNPDAPPGQRKETEYKKEEQLADKEYQYKVRNGQMSPNPAFERGMKLRQAFHRVKFDPCAVYDISDTVIVNERLANRPMATQSNWITQINTNNDNSAIANKIFEIAKRSLIANGIQVTQNPATGAEASWSTSSQINVSSNVTGTYAVSTILKEWAGKLLHHEGGEFYDNTLKYFEEKGNLSAANMMQIQRVQESTAAAAICNNLGLPTNEHPTYMALLKAQGGLDSGQLIKENVSTITAVCNYILKELKRHEGEIDAVAGEGGADAQPNAQQGAEVQQGAAVTQPQQ